MRYFQSFALCIAFFCFFFEDSTINGISQKFEFDETRHRQIFDAIDHDNDGYISKKEWMKATALSFEQCVIPMDKIHKIFEEMNDGKKVSFDLWMKCVSAINCEEQEKEKKNNAVHIMTVMKCIENVWKSLGSAHREGAYQKALLFDLVEHGYSVQMERRVPVYHFTKYRKKLHLVSIERIDLFISKHQRLSLKPKQFQQSSASKMNTKRKNTQKTRNVCRFWSIFQTTEMSSK